MAEDSTRFAGAVLEEIHDDLKESFEDRQNAYLKDGASSKGFAAPKALDVENVDEIIKVTNDGMSNAAKNNTRKEVRGVSRQGNLLLSLARDNYGATSSRLKQCTGYALYLKRALHEADSQEDPTKSDGMLRTGIRKVEQ